MPIMLAIKGWRKGVGVLDGALVDKDDPKAVEEYEKRKDEKKGITKVPAVLGNVWKKVATKKGDKVPKEPPAKS
ncbi:expressed protein [Chlorella variabilis]|uniref:Expressed protein n=1 Tax=Chlorella variabilis TaxID=554065 RepID=E1Z8V5_CHLVA|nr:expressed protein [Chlorella variabilis]EFN57673.1 expressed protein [Chlorella variabilis]|eukprot:XP_005849775.1 expressed protein [Chlorella variabilis]